MNVDGWWIRLEHWQMTFHLTSGQILIYFDSRKHMDMCVLRCWETSFICFKHHHDLLNYADKVQDICCIVSHHLVSSTELYYDLSTLTSKMQFFPRCTHKDGVHPRLILKQSLFYIHTLHSFIVLPEPVHVKMFLHVRWLSALGLLVICNNDIFETTILRLPFPGGARKST